MRRRLHCSPTPCCRTGDSNSVSSLAAEIQRTQYEDTGAADWRIEHVYCRQGDDAWESVHFDHTTANGLDVYKHLAAGRDASIAGLLPPGRTWKGPHRLAVLPFPTYRGSASVRAREVMSAMFSESVVAGAGFYVPVDLAHATGAPTLLNYTFDPGRSFEENLDELRRLKCADGDTSYIAENERWRKHLAPRLWWLSFLRISTPAPAVIMRRYNYDAGLQGLGVFQCATESLWTFSFNAQPELEYKFVERFGLTPTGF